MNWINYSNKLECVPCEINTADHCGFASTMDGSIVWCPRCGERLTRIEDRLIDEAVARAEIYTERALGVR